MTIDIAALGRQSMADQMTGKMKFCEVTKWVDPETKKPVKVYWKPLRGTEQKIIDQGADTVARTALTVQLRARYADGKMIFSDTSLESLIQDYEYPELRAIAFLMSTDVGQTEKEQEQQVEDIEKE